MKNGKSPGIDGLPIEFYKVQYEMIKNTLLQLKFHSFPNENLTPSMNQTIITLIPKKRKKEIRKKLETNILALRRL